LILILGTIFGIFNPEIIILFLCVSILYGWILTISSIIIEEATFRKYKSTYDYFKLFVGVILEQLGYHQIHLYWRLRGILRFIRGKSDWGEMKRKGFMKK
jgi:hypothetical protein